MYDDDNMSEGKELSLMGYDEFGQPAGHPFVGAVAGGALQRGGSIVARLMDMDKHAELIGVGASTLGAVVVGLVKPEQRTTAWAMGVVGAVVGGLEYVFQMMSDKEQLKNQVAEDGTGLVEIFDQPRVGSDLMGQPISHSNGFAGALNMPVIDRTKVVGGGMQGPALPQLVGDNNYMMNNNPGAQHAQLVGTPKLDGLAAHYGATLFNQV